MLSPCLCLSSSRNTGAASAGTARNTLDPCLRLSVAKRASVAFREHCCFDALVQGLVLYLRVRACLSALKSLSWR